MTEFLRTVVGRLRQAQRMIIKVNIATTLIQMLLAAVAVIVPAAVLLRIRRHAPSRALDRSPQPGLQSPNRV